MSGHYPPLTAGDVETILRNLGFKPRPRKSTSHENWVTQPGVPFRKVTLDRPKAPFSQDLIRFMARQAGLSKKQFYAALSKKK